MRDRRTAGHCPGARHDTFSDVTLPRTFATPGAAGAIGGSSSSVTLTVTAIVSVPP